MSRTAFVVQLRGHFDQVAVHVFAQLQAHEDVTLNLSAEESLFIRFNGNRVRQNTDVVQIEIALQLQSEGRTVQQSRTLTGTLEADLSAMTQLLQNCRAEIKLLPPDPHQVPIANHGSSDEVFEGSLPESQEVVRAVVQGAAGSDLAGLYAGGVVIRGNQNSKGQRHWFATESFFLDYSLYKGYRAAKGSYAGTQWNDGEWQANLSRTRHLLSMLDRPQQSVKPGQYRSYLAPKATADLLGMLGWYALSGAAWKQGLSPFKRLAEKQASLSPLLSVRENFGLGLSPRFNSQGEVSQANLSLIEAGELKALLVNSRSAAEYGLQANAANEFEAPRAMDVAAGVLQEQDILQQLHTGLYLSNLHYLNWSDRVSARVTGMTRYACFWVEQGEIVGPITDMRWDESFYEALGCKLLALTAHTEISPEVQTYSRRPLGGVRTPGALIEGFTYTL